MLTKITTTFAGDHHAFAVLTDTYEQAYVPNSVVSAIKLEVGRTYRAGVVENRHDPKGQTPWFVTFIEGADFGLRDGMVDEIDEDTIFSPLRDLLVEEPEAVEPEVPQLTISEIVRAAVPAMGGEPFIASELAAIVEINNKDASTVLNNMFILGEISCAKVYRSGGQAKSTQTVFCSDVRRLLK